MWRLFLSRFTVHIGKYQKKREAVWNGLSSLCNFGLWSGTCGIDKNVIWTPISFFIQSVECSIFLIFPSFLYKCRTPFLCAHWLERRSLFYYDSKFQVLINISPHFTPWVVSVITNNFNSFFFSFFFAAIFACDFPLLFVVYLTRSDCAVLMLGPHSLRFGIAFSHLFFLWLTPYALYI